MDATARARLVRAALLVALLLVTLTWAVTRVFVLNFSTAGPNATALLALSLVTGWTLPAAARLPHVSRERVCLLVLGVGMFASLSGDPVIALAGAALAGAGVLPLLSADARALGERVGVAAGLGLLVVLALRGVLGAASPFATPVGRGLLLALFGGAVAVGRGDFSGDESTPIDRLPAVAPLAAATFLAALWLGYPTVSARWAGRSYLLSLTLSAGGVLGGGVWVAARGAPRVRGAVAWGAILLGGLGALLFGGSPAVGALVPATAAMVVLASTAGLGEHGIRRVGLATVVTQLCALVGVVGFVLAVNWAFVPVVGPTVRGLEPAAVLGLGALLGVSAAAAVRSETGRGGDARHGVGRSVPDTLDATRRALVGGAAAGLLAMVGGWVRRPRPVTPPDGDFRVATYNVHQFFDATGRYNLRAVAAALRRQEVGIVGLQETEGARVSSGNVHGVRWLAAALGYHHHAGPGARVGGYGVSLLSAWPIRDVEVVELPRAATATRPAMRATVEHPDGDVTVAVVHLETAGDVRLRQARRVRELVVDAERTVVLGDFNATPDEPVYDAMTDEFVDGWAVAGSGDGFTFSAGRPRRRIDYVFYRGFAATEATVFGGPAESDHRGVAATLARS